MMRAIYAAVAAFAITLLLGAGHHRLFAAVEVWPDGEK